MKKYFLYFASLFIILVSCGKVKPKDQIGLQKKELPSFVNLELNGKFRTFFVNSKSNFVEIETYPNIFENLDIKVKNQTLYISEKRKTKGVDFYNITIYSRNSLQKIYIADSVEFNVSGEIDTNNFYLNLKNNGKFIGAIRSSKAEVEMQQTSLANFRGFTQNAVIKLKDTANILAPYWKINNMQMELKNETFAEFFVEDSLKGNVENTSKLIYYGNPVRAFKRAKEATVKNTTLE